MNKIVIGDIILIAEEISEQLTANKQFLNDLDGNIGDGDIGINLSEGFIAINKLLQSKVYNDIGLLIQECGMELANKAPSTLGSLLAMGLLAAGKIMIGRVELYLNDLVLINEAICNEIIARGKAKVGDKTIIDALSPGLGALRDAQSKNLDILEAYKLAVPVVEEAANATAKMQSRTGRSAWLGERSIGYMDPGAHVCVILFNAVITALQKVKHN